MKIPIFDTADDVFTAVVHDVYEAPDHITTRKGHVREHRNVSFAVTDPRDRIVYRPDQRLNIVRRPLPRTAREVQ